ncbi:hypothetical protein ACJ41P_10520 [Azospirillum argentinense]|uniref:Uncharacterized protein n=1 Tax=Azospirillum argentinense TaxID=2970906 RepID=A0ABW8V4X4_9PROT
MKNLTNADRAAAMKMIEGWLAGTILKETGAAVQVKRGSRGKWSMWGAADAVETAMTVVLGSGVATEQERFEDDGEVFSYFTIHGEA